MDSVRRRWLLLAVVGMVLATVSYGTILATRPFGISAATADALGLSMLILPVVYFGALVTGQFPFEEYRASRGVDGILIDALAIFLGCLLAAFPAAYAVTTLGIDGTRRLVAVGAVAYFTGFGVFTVRNLRFYRPTREGSSADT